MKAKDLAREVPRSPYDVLAGFPWLGRLVDKVRAKQAGTLGDYTPYPCGADRHFLAYFGLDTDTLEALIASGASDEDVASWCQANARRTDAAGYRRTQFDPIAAERRPALDAYRREVQLAHPELDLSGADNFAMLIALEEGHPIPES